MEGNKQFARGNTKQLFMSFLPLFSPANIPKSFYQLFIALHCYSGPAFENCLVSYQATSHHVPLFWKSFWTEYPFTQYFILNVYQKSSVWKIFSTMCSESDTAENFSLLSVLVKTVGAFCHLYFTHVWHALQSFVMPHILYAAQSSSGLKEPLTNVMY